MSCVPRRPCAPYRDVARRRRRARSADETWRVLVSGQRTDEAQQRRLHRGVLFRGGKGTQALRRRYRYKPPSTGSVAVCILSTWTGFFLTTYRRKKAWEENDANPHVFPHKLFNEVELQSIFDCTVEVGVFLFVTFKNPLAERRAYRSFTRSIMRQAHPCCTLPTTPNAVILLSRQRLCGVMSTRVG